MPSSVSVAFIVVLLGGAMIAVQGAINATLGRAVGSSVNAALISFLVGTLALALIASVQRVSPDDALVRGLPWWAWVGGLCGAVFVTAAAYAAPRVGVASMLTLAIASQLVMAIALDHRGGLGVPVRSASTGRAVGIALVMLGAWLVRRY